MRDTGYSVATGAANCCRPADISNADPWPLLPARSCIPLQTHAAPTAAIPALSAKARLKDHFVGSGIDVSCYQIGISRVGRR